MARRVCTKDQEFTNDQLARIDDVHNAVYDLCRMLTEKDDLEYDMAYIGEIADVACDVLHLRGYRVRYPAVVEEGSKRYIIDYMDE